MNTEQARTIAKAADERDRALANLRNAVALGDQPTSALGAEDATPADSRIVAAGEAYARAEFALTDLLKQTDAAMAPLGSLGEKVKLGDPASGVVDDEDGDPVRPHAA